MVDFSGTLRKALNRFGGACSRQGWAHSSDAAASPALDRLPWRIEADGTDEMAVSSNLVLGR